MRPRTPINARDLPIIHDDTVIVVDVVNVEEAVPDFISSVICSAEGSKQTGIADILALSDRGVVYPSSSNIVENVVVMSCVPESVLLGRGA